MMTIDTISSRIEQDIPRRKSLGTMWRGLIRGLLAWSSRSALSELTEDQLRDIGLNEEEARREARRSLMVRLDGSRLPPF
jgi:uncharacterized protein YjiS (DUF1127 family)